MSLSRLPNWTTRLDSFLASRRSVPFKYGTNDCVLFAIDAVLAVTGTDLGRPFRGKYKSARGAASVMRRYAGAAGLQSCAAALAAAWDLCAIRPAHAQRADVGYGIDPEFGPTVVVRGADAWFGPGPAGTARSHATVLLAWAVGRSV